VFEWIGSNPMPPEFWILPSFLPMHPGLYISFEDGSTMKEVLLSSLWKLKLLINCMPFPWDTAKMWCYCRMVYMPMSYLYGKRFVGPITPLILQLREELYTQPYNEVNWKKVRHLCAKVSLVYPHAWYFSNAFIQYAKLLFQEDIYYPHPLIQDLLWDGLYIFTEPLLTRWPFNKLVREKALQVTMKHIHYEDENSRYITIGCVEKVMLWSFIQSRDEAMEISIYFGYTYL